MDLAVLIVLIVLMAAFVWVGVEVALAVRKLRGQVGDLMGQVDKTVQDVNVTIKKVDQAVEDLNPAIQEVKPLMGKVETTVDALSLDLLQVNNILNDVGTLTGAASDATTAVTGVVDKAAAAASKAVGKLGKKGKAGAEALEASVAEKAAQLQGDIEPSVETVSQDAGYFTYPTESATSDTASEEK